jgi:hypothetical protein
MTITPSSDAAVLHQGGLPIEQHTADPIALFLANELFPMMTAFWPASANQLDSNASNTAQAWALMLRGFPVGKVREAVLQLAEDVDRQFAPRPAEVKEVLLTMMKGGEKVAACSISVRACEVIAEARIFMRCGVVKKDELSQEVALVVDEMCQSGAVITGRVM